MSISTSRISQPKGKPENHKFSLGKKKPAQLELELGNKAIIEDEDGTEYG